MRKQVSSDSLDTTQYSTSSILLYESVYGEDFVSPGGLDMARELISRIGVDRGSRVLDAGCGLGGSAFVMAREFGFRVHGIDLSRNMLTMANRKLTGHGLSDLVTLEMGDCLKLDRPGSYDAVYSRDVFLHIEDKTRLFRVLKSSLRPQGRLLFTDYCCGARPWSDEFADYVQRRGYHLHTLPEYVELISAAGFRRVVCEDLTDKFIEILQADLERIGGLDINESDRNLLLESWRGKLARSRSGSHRWGLFGAERDPDPDSE